MLRSCIVALVCLFPLTSAAQDAPADAAEAPDDTPSLTWVLERARALDGQTDYASAAELYEVYANACLDTATAVLEPGGPCDATDEALARAAELRSALGDVALAARNAELFGRHFLYAQPRRALEVRFGVARLQLEQDRLDEAERTLDAVEASGDAREAIVTDGMRARIAARRGEHDRATQAWRRVERRWERDRETLVVDGALPLEWVETSVADALLHRAEAYVERYLATPGPNLRGVRLDSRWWAIASRWMLRAQRRLTLARAALERVYELGSVRHRVIAAGRIGELYAHYESAHAAVPVPDDEVLRALWGGDQRPGYDQARTHFETCVAWARNHSVAPSWGARCEARLHALDPFAYPMQAELHGEAGYLPASTAEPLAVPE